MCSPKQRRELRIPPQWISLLLGQNDRYHRAVVTKYWKAFLAVAALVAIGCFGIFSVYQTSKGYSNWEHSANLSRDLSPTTADDLAAIGLAPPKPRTEMSLEQVSRLMQHLHQTGRFPDATSWRELVDLYGAPYQFSVRHREPENWYWTSKDRSQGAKEFVFEIRTPNWDEVIEY